MIDRLKPRVYNNPHFGVIASGMQGNAYIVATGGSIATDGNYKVHTFTTSGTFAISCGTGCVEYLVVGGGQGGGGGSGTDGPGGGGGSGEARGE